MTDTDTLTGTEGIEGTGGRAGGGDTRRNEMKEIADDTATASSQS